MPMTLFRVAKRGPNKLLGVVESVSCSRGIRHGARVEIRLADREGEVSSHLLAGSREEAVEFAARLVDAIASLSLLEAGVALHDPRCLALRAEAEDRASQEVRQALVARRGRRR